MQSERHGRPRSLLGTRLSLRHERTHGIRVRLCGFVGSRGTHWTLLDRRFFDLRFTLCFVAKVVRIQDTPPRVDYSFMVQSFLEC